MVYLLNWHSRGSLGGLYLVHWSQENREAFSPVSWPPSMSSEKSRPPNWPVSDMSPSLLSLFVSLHLFDEELSSSRCRGWGSLRLKISSIENLKGLAGGWSCWPGPCSSGESMSAFFELLAESLGEFLDWFPVHSVGDFLLHIFSGTIDVSTVKGPARPARDVPLLVIFSAEWCPYTKCAAGLMCLYSLSWFIWLIWKARKSFSGGKQKR